MRQWWRCPQVIPSRPPAVSVRVYCLHCRWSVPASPDGILRACTHLAAAHDGAAVRGRDWACGGRYELRPAAGVRK